MARLVPFTRKHNTKSHQVSHSVEGNPLRGTVAVFLPFGTGLGVNRIQEQERHIGAELFQFRPAITGPGSRVACINKDVPLGHQGLDVREVVLVFQS